MKWAYSIVLVGIGVIGCTGKIPPPRGEVLNVDPADITTDVTPQITDIEPIHQRKRKLTNRYVGPRLQAYQFARNPLYPDIVMAMH